MESQLTAMIMSITLLKVMITAWFVDYCGTLLHLCRYLLILFVSVELIVVRSKLVICAIFPFVVTGV